MRDNIVQVSIWGKNVGLLSWDDKRGCSSFQFDRDFINSGLDIAPLVAPFKKFNDYAEQVGISEYWISRIQDILSDNQVLKNTD